MGMTRRRFVTIAAATAAAGPLVTFGSAHAESGLNRWAGEALGAEASVTLAGFDDAAAARLFTLCEAEVARQEGLFSLYLEDSVLSRLNHDGVVDDAPAGFIDLLAQARNAWTETGGAFDPTVQPLWALYADHFSHAVDEQSPPETAIEATLALVGYAHVLVEQQRVHFAVPGMAMTLNGIAQGYITDRITDLLRANGAEHVLVDIGEYRAIGAHPTGRPWQLGLRDPQQPWSLIDEITLDNAALSTSGGYGQTFDADGRFTHLLDPRTGRAAPRYGSVSVRADTAAMADALSTAFSIMSETEIAAVARSVGDIDVWLIDRENRIKHLTG